MAPDKRSLLRYTIIGVALWNLSIALAVRWLPWWQLLLIYAAANFLFTNSLAAFLVFRHLSLIKKRAEGSIQWQRPRGQIQRRRSALDYHLFVLGSGGHTKEMLMMMDDGFCDFDGFHRRYMVSSGDNMSRNHLEEYEADLKLLCKKCGNSEGTYDVKVVTRARRVHQPLWTTPFSALRSLRDIFGVLLSPPSTAAGRKLQYPRIIFSNGPATGFIVALAVHLLKMIYVVPENRCWFVYIESWARISTLSLTGKLLYHTGIADAFAVQHGEVAEKYQVHNVGPVVLNSRRADAPSEG